MSGIGGATSAGTSGATSGGTDGSGTSGATSGGTSGGGSGGTTAGSSGAAGSGGGATTCSATPGDVEIATSIPDQFKQPSTEAGRMEKHSYPCYYYTDLTSGQSGDPSEFVLSRRDQPITKEFNIYLPYQYSPDVAYPVIFILHGITDNEETWLERGDPHPARLLDNLIAADEIRPVIAVFPNGNSSSTFLNRDFSNQAGYYFFANELVNDLIPFIESEWSVASDRNCRAMTGFSMGGMQTINAGLCQSLEHIAWFGALSAAPTTYGSNAIAEYLEDEDPTTYPINYFYNVVGASDGTARASHEAAVQNLNTASDYISDDNFTYHTVPGDHVYPVASIGLYNLLRLSFSK
jgi:enterochelin esterase-like enzyme